MDDILSFLESLTQPDQLPKEYFSLLDAMGPYTTVIHQTLSMEFLDELNEAQSEVLEWERQECFARGFRLGAKLMLAVFDGPH